MNEKRFNQPTTIPTAPAYSGGGGGWGGGSGDGFWLALLIVIAGIALMRCVHG